MSELVRYKNLGSFSRALEKEVTSVLELVAEDVKKEIDEALIEYYSEYEPGENLSSAEKAAGYYYYHRTNQLKNSCKISPPRLTGGSVQVDIYLDVDSLNYTQKGANAYKTVIAANQGLHGGWNVDNPKHKYQVPWNSINPDSNDKHANGTQIWSMPMVTLFEDGKLEESFLKHAQNRGLNIK